MHDSVMAWGARWVETLGIAEHDVLELGSYDVNGTFRPLFQGSYVGLDIRPGPGVDVVASAGDVPFPDALFDVVVCTEMFEHDLTFWRSTAEARRVLRRGGFFLVSCRGFNFPPHDFPADYFRFSKEAMAGLFKFTGLEAVEVVTDLGPGYPGVLAVAVVP